MGSIRKISVFLKAHPLFPRKHARKLVTSVCMYYANKRALMNQIIHFKVDELITPMQNMVNISIQIVNRNKLRHSVTICLKRKIYLNLWEFISFIGIFIDMYSYICVLSFCPHLCLNTNTKLSISGVKTIGKIWRMRYTA